jgi:putative addiction module killer protein
VFDIQIYRADTGAEPYGDWLRALPDRHAKARIVVRVGRMASGNMGDVKPVGQGVWEARIDCGPGYRIYYAQVDRRVLLLLLGGDKRKQQSDIELAQAYWADWKHRRSSK